MTDKNKDKSSPSQKREQALSQMLQRLGASQTKSERYNNGFAHFSLATHSSQARAHELRMASFTEEVNVTIREVIPIKKTDKPEEKLVGKTIMVKRPIFSNTMTLTKWIENFYQESPSINARARDDQREIGVAAFGQQVTMGFTPFGTNEEKLDDS